MECTGKVVTGNSPVRLDDIDSLNVQPTASNDIDIGHSEEAGLNNAFMHQNLHEYKAALSIYLFWINQDSNDAYENCCEMLQDIADQSVLMTSKRSEMCFVDPDKSAIEQAVDFCVDADEQDDPAAALMLGEMYALGVGVEKNRGEAHKYFKKATEFELAIAHYQIWKLRIGDDLVDRTEAVKNLKQAADQGFVRALIELAEEYCGVTDGNTNYKKAAQCFKKAFENGCEVKTLYRHVNFVLSKMKVDDFAYFNDDDFFDIAVNALKDDSEFNTLGEMYEKGCGVNPDFSKAVAYYRKGQESCEDYPDKLLDIFNGSDWVLADPEFGRSYLKIASLGGLASDAGERFLREHGEPLTYTEILAHFKKAGAIGSFYLGLMYEHGVGVEKNSDKAFKHYKQAFQLCSPEQDSQLGIKGKMLALCLNGTAMLADPEFTLNFFTKCAPITNYLTPYLTLLNFSKVVTHFIIMDQQNDPAGTYKLGVMYEYGAGIAQDRSAAFKCYKRADEMGYKAVKEKISAMCLSGEAIKFDENFALYYLENAALKGHPDARATLLNQLGVLVGKYLNEKNVLLVQKYLLKANEHDCIDAPFALGMRYEFGDKGISQNYRKALNYYKTANDRGNLNAPAKLAELCLKDEVIKIDPEFTKHYLEEAASKGNEPAQLKLDQINLTSFKRSNESELNEVTKKARYL